MGILREIMGILRVNYGFPNYGYLRVKLWVFLMMVTV